MKKHRCPVCEHAQLKPFLQRSQGPIRQNLEVTSQDAARTVTHTGFAVECVEHIFGVQYLWLEAHMANVDETLPTTGETAQLATAYTTDEQKLREFWLAHLHDLGQNEKMALGDPGAKGATFANLVDPDCALIDCNMDLSPNNQGRFIPGTSHPIDALADQPSRGACNAVRMNQNHRKENLQLQAKAGTKLNLINWSER
jgi:hypothetical protein